MKCGNCHNCGIVPTCLIYLTDLCCHSYADASLSGPLGDGFAPNCAIGETIQIEVE